MSTKTLMTIEEFARMETADTEAYELVDGELVPLSSPTPKHARIRGRIEHSLSNYFALHPIGEPFGDVDCQVVGGNVRRPDLAVFLGERLGQMDVNQVPVPFAPDIAVEVLSPNESAVDVHRKVKEYLHAGSQEVWVLDHLNDQMFVHTGSDSVRVISGNGVLESPLLPGFCVLLRDLFA